MDARRVVGWILVLVSGAVLAILVASFGIFTLAALARGSGWGAVAEVAYLLGAAIFPLVFLLVGWRLAHPTQAPPAPHPAPAPVSDLDEAATDEVELLAQLEGPISACPRCGYLGVRPPGIRDGLWPGGGETGARFVCPRCQFQGIPIEFENGDEYREFVRGLRNAL